MTYTNNKHFAAALNSKDCHSRALKTYKKFQSLVKKGQCRQKKIGRSGALLLTLTAHLTPGAPSYTDGSTSHKFKNYMLDKHFLGSLKAESKRCYGPLVRDQANLLNGAALCAGLTFLDTPEAYINKKGGTLSYALADALKNQPTLQPHVWQQIRPSVSGQHTTIYGSLLFRPALPPLYIRPNELKQARIASLQYKCHPYIIAAQVIRYLCRQTLAGRRVVLLTPRYGRTYIKKTAQASIV